MAHPEYPDWVLEQRLLVDGYPLLVLEKNGQRVFKSEGRSQEIIEFLLPLNEAGDDWEHVRDNTRVWCIHNQLHHAFITGSEWTDGQGNIWMTLFDPVVDFAEHECEEFLEFLEIHHKRTGQPLIEPIWHVACAWWRAAFTYITKSSIEKIYQVKRNIHDGTSPLLEGVVIAPDEATWDDP